MITRLVRVTFLTAIWVLLWGRLSAANVLGGILISTVVLAMNPDRRPHRSRGRRVSATGILRLAGYLLVQFAVSNALVLRQILRRRSRARTAVISCPLRVSTEPVMTFLANVLSLTPGTIPIELRLEPASIVLHVLDLRDPVDVRSAVARLERLSVEAFGTADERAALAAGSRRDDLHEVAS